LLLSISSLKRQGFKWGANISRLGEFRYPGNIGLLGASNLITCEARVAFIYRTTALIRQFQADSLSIPALTPMHQVEAAYGGVRFGMAV